MCYTTPVQHKIGSDKIIQRYTHSTWKIIFHFQKMISDVYTWTTWNLFDDMVVHYTCTIWLSRHLYNLISGFYTYTTWNLYLYGKVTYFTLHSQTLIFITLAKHDFGGFFILVVCMFFYIYIFRTYIYVLTKSLSRTVTSVASLCNSKRGSKRKQGELVHVVKWRQKAVILQAVVSPTTRQT